jgi:hypothetical protein
MDGNHAGAGDQSHGTDGPRLKPYQMQLIRQHGFAIPETLITNDPSWRFSFITSMKGDL